MRRTLLLLIAAICLLAGEPAAAKRRYPRGNRVGLFLAHNTPAPATLGANVGIHLFDFVRLEGGFGMGGDAVGSGASTLAASMITSVGYLLTGGLVKWEDIYRFVSGGPPPGNYVTTWGGGARFFLPQAPLVPSIGIHYAAGTAVGSVGGVSGSFGHVYYTLGIDWQSRVGLNLGAGLNLCLSLPEPSRYLLYVHVGWFF